MGVISGPGGSTRTVHGGNLVMLASRGRALFFWHDIKADLRVSIPIGAEARRSKGLLSLS